MWRGTKLALRDVSLMNEIFFFFLISFPFFGFFFFQLSSSLALESRVRLGCESIGPTPKGIRDARGKAFLNTHMQRGNVHP